jgi:hypothetical protein
MIELLRTGSGIMTINPYSRSHWNEILSLDRQLNLAVTTEQKYSILRQIRMFSINVPIIMSVIFNHRTGFGDTPDYTMVEADYYQQLGLVLDDRINY